MFISGTAEESINKGFISIAFFLPFFPLEEPLPFPFPVVLVTYGNNSEGNSKISSGVFTCSAFNIQGEAMAEGSSLGSSFHEVF
jgi:hypothetical protein